MERKDIYEICLEVADRSIRRRELTGQYFPEAIANAVWLDYVKSYREKDAGFSDGIRYRLVQVITTTALNRRLKRDRRYERLEAAKEPNTQPYQTTPTPTMTEAFVRKLIAKLPPHLGKLVGFAHERQQTMDEAKELIASHFQLDRKTLRAYVSKIYQAALALLASHDVTL